MELKFIFMNWDATTTLVLVVTFFCTYWLWQAFSRKAYPPGPMAWPVIGHIPKIISGKSRMKFFNEVADRFGPITTIWIGLQPGVLLNTQEAIHEAFVVNADLFDSRPFPVVAQIVFGGKPVGVILTNGETHKTMRKVALTALHEFGLGKQSLEEKIQVETCALSDELKRIDGQPISNIRKNIQLAISNVIISICFGNRLSYTDEEFLEITNHVDNFFRNNLLFQPENVFPFLTRLPIKLSINQQLEAQFSFKKYVAKQIESHRTTFDPDNIRDMVDLYLKAEQEKDRHLHLDNFSRMIVDLFVAGTETTATTVTWLLLFLVVDPQIQEKARKEITKVLGKHTLPVGKDRERLIYIDALLHEVHRYCSIASLGIPRFLNQDAKICGQVIPKGCYIFPNIYRVHMDKSYWKDPEVFRPERWIDENGCLIKHDHYMPFSIGKRACIGESFAKIEVFIVVTILLQRFKFSLPSGSPRPSLDGQFDVVRTPVSFELCAVPV